ncbi:hypothetical protein A3Q56_01722 [Intoshia linei]|uniref:C3H1-type domain-containing protein n=1 Tax=Intoshia linei TaxID=1819745 RepID=A0A177BA27_9BILA|nr:hypothetical protein A3Q56_01722 [Intoshia linei]
MNYNYLNMCPSHSMANMMNYHSLVSSNVKETQWLTLEVCRDFQRYACPRNEEECKYAHPPSHVEVSNGRVTCCYDYIKARCSREDPPCKYMHPPEHLKHVLLYNGRQNIEMRRMASTRFPLNSMFIPKLLYPTPYMMNTLQYQPMTPPYKYFNPANHYQVPIEKISKITEQNSQKSLSPRNENESHIKYENNPPNEPKKRNATEMHINQQISHKKRIIVSDGEDNRDYIIDKKNIVKGGSNSLTISPNSADNVSTRSNDTTHNLTCWQNSNLISQAYQHQIAQHQLKQALINTLNSPMNLIPLLDINKSIISKSQSKNLVQSIEMPNSIDNNITKESILIVKK